MRECAILLILLVCAAFACGCTAPATTQNTQQPAVTMVTQPVLTGAPVSNGITKTVIIRQKSFDPDIVTISPGTTVVWTNEDSFNHRVVHMPERPNEPELFHSDLLTKGDTFSYTFQYPGRYYYSSPQYAGGRKSVVIVE